MENFTLSELGLFVATLSGAIVSLIFAVQKSKCSSINSCVIKCERKIPDDLPNPPPAEGLVAPQGDPPPQA